MKSLRDEIAVMKSSCDKITGNPTKDTLYVNVFCIVFILCIKLTSNIA